MKLNEDTLAQQPTADYLHKVLGWDSLYAFDREDFGPNSLLGRKDATETVLTRDLRAALERLNPDYSAAIYETAVRDVVEYSRSQTMLQINCEKYDIIKQGVPVSVPLPNGNSERRYLKVIDFDNEDNNRFLAVRELKIKGDTYNRRADVIGFVNGLPLVFIELKTHYKSLRAAYDGNLSDYKDVIPHLFHHNAIIILGNGTEAKLGSLTSRYEHFFDWKRLSEGEPGVVDMQTLLRGVCSKKTLLDIVENFIVFDDSTGNTVKIIAQNHQFLGVNEAVQAVRERKARAGKLGVFWHTQGSGKSYSMVFFTQKVLHKLGGTFTFLLLTDRDDLDSQLYKTFAGCGLVKGEPEEVRANSGEHLQALLKANNPFVFSLIQKFNKKVETPYTERDDVIVISDEAHRTQGGILAINMRDALPNAARIGFTGTPLMGDAEDKNTEKVFGEYISTYDFGRAVDDNATVPLYYDARGEKLGITTTNLNEKIAAKIEEFDIEDKDTADKLKRELAKEYLVFTAQKRLEQIAKDFATHYSTRWESGKAMFVCLDKLTAGRMLLLLQKEWQEQIKLCERDLKRASSEQELAELTKKLAWLRETQMALVVSEEQGEVAKFKEWDIDIKPHRKLIKEGFEGEDGKRLDLELAFKRPEHPFRVAVVCAMWLTGFDVPSLATLYLDKPLKAHTLMQTIARANRVYEGKTNGLIVDYCGILKDLRKALATFAGTKGKEEGLEVDPLSPTEDLIAKLGEVVLEAETFVNDKGFDLLRIITEKSFERNAAIKDGKNLIRTDDESRRRFGLLYKEVDRRFKACVNESGRNVYRDKVDALKALAKDEREVKNISDLMRQMHDVVDGAMTVQLNVSDDETTKYDISKVNFEKLREEFAGTKHKNIAVQDLKDLIEKRLAMLLKKNPKRLSYQQRYEEIIDAYNRDKDRAAIEATFEALLQFAESLSEEETRAVREGLDEESLALFDLLVKPDLSKKERDQIKGVAKGLLERLQAEKLLFDLWRERKDTQDRVKTAILDFLYGDNTGLPESYSEDEVSGKTEEVFGFLLSQPQNAILRA